MKKLKFIITALLGFFLIACNNVNINEVLGEFIATLPYELDNDLDIPSAFNYKRKDYVIDFVSNDQEYLSNQGKVSKVFLELNVSATISATYKDQKTTEVAHFVLHALKEDEVKSLLLEEINIPSSTSENILLPTKFEYLSYTGILTWTSSQPSTISNNGIVGLTSSNTEVTLSLNLEIAGKNYNFPTFKTITVLGVPDQEILDKTVANFNLPLETTEDLYLPAKIGGVAISWSSSNTSLITEAGKFRYPEASTLVTISGVFIYKGKVKEKTFDVIALQMPNEERFQLALDSFTIPEKISMSLYLPTEFDNFVTATWTSSNDKVITPSGNVYLSENEQEVKLTITLTSGSVTYSVDYFVLVETNEGLDDFMNKHLFVDYAYDFNPAFFSNVVLEGDRLVLENGYTLGSYQSPVIRTNYFTWLLGTWASTSSVDATANILVRVRVNGQWSMYFDYGSFGLGLQNKTFSQSDSLAYITNDVLFISNNRTADAYQYKVVLKRTTVNATSPKLSLVSASLVIPNYEYPVDITNIPKRVEYTMPALNQYIVPDIGPSICSPTSATMLLMHKGYTFDDVYPHREVAIKLKDYGSNIFGNWIFNTVGMGGYGANSYVKRIYSFEELLYHLATVGPVSWSVTGDMGPYTTGGHLIAIKGYEITANGRFLLVHDSALSVVNYKYSEEVFHRVTKNIIYVIE